MMGFLRRGGVTAKIKKWRKKTKMKQYEQPSVQICTLLDVITTSNESFDIEWVVNPWGEDLQ